MHPQNQTPLQVTRFESCESTNQLLLKAAEHGAPTGSVYVANEQTAGRGRRGRSWVSAPGCTLAFSLLHSFPLVAGGLSGLSLVVGVAIMRALASPSLGVPVDGIRLGLKWPNDILLRCADGTDAKAGGVLIESTLRRAITGEQEMAVVIGVGLNCLPSSVINDTVQDQSVAALSEAYDATQPLVPDTLLPVVLEALSTTLNEFACRGFTAFREEWQSYHLWQNEAVRITEGGNVLLEGVVRGVDSDGALSVATLGGFERVVTGDLSLRKV